MVTLYLKDKDVVVVIVPSAEVWKYLVVYFIFKI
jgi:hypothetical protein